MFRAQSVQRASWPTHQRLIAMIDADEVAMTLDVEFDYLQNELRRPCFQSKDVDVGCQGSYAWQTAAAQSAMYTLKSFFWAYSCTIRGSSILEGQREPSKRNQQEDHGDERSRGERPQGLIYTKNDRQRRGSYVRYR